MGCRVSVNNVNLIAGLVGRTQQALTRELGFELFYIDGINNRFHSWEV